MTFFTQLDKIGDVIVTVEYKICGCVSQYCIATRVTLIRFLDGYSYSLSGINLEPLKVTGFSNYGIILLRPLACAFFSALLALL